jgi:hypothetical protein
MAKILGRSFVDGLVGELNRIGQANCPVRYCFKTRSSHRNNIPRILAEIIEDRINCDLAGQFPGLLPAHAIAHDEDAVAQIVTKIVLVVLADEADIGYPGRLDQKAHVCGRRR